MSREKFEDLALVATCLGIVGVLLMLYAFMQPPKRMAEPPVVREETRIKIAVIDTGLQLSNEIRPYLCKQGHYSLYDSSPLTDDNELKHGTNVAGLIAQNLNPHRECLLIIKMVGKYINEWEWSFATQRSVEYAIKQNAKFINLSFGGPNASQEEFKMFSELVKSGIHFSVAAGNYKNDLDKKCNYYPACYGKDLNSEFFQAIGSSTGDYSNKAKFITILEDGTNKGAPIPLAGTSQATAIHTGKWVRKLAQ